MTTGILAARGEFLNIDIRKAHKEEASQIAEISVGMAGG
jgi:hypothetical protein